MSQLHISAAHAPDELPPMPIEPEWIQEGTPTACGTVLNQSEDKLLSSGYWSCTSGKFKWEFVWDEFVTVLEGEAIIREEDGTTHTLRAGDVAHFPRGMTTYWEVPTFIRKFFTLRTVEPFHL